MDFEDNGVGKSIELSTAANKAVGNSCSLFSEVGTIDRGNMKETT